MRQQLEKNPGLNADRTVQNLYDAISGTPITREEYERTVKEWIRRYGPSPTRRILSKLHRLYYRLRGKPFPFAGRSFWY